MSLLLFTGFLLVIPLPRHVIITTTTTNNNDINNNDNNSPYFSDTW